MKVSSVKKARIRTSFVDRKTNVGKTDAVESISSVKRIQNSAYHSSENSLMFFENFYDNLKELKEEYKKFYHDEQLLEEAIDNLSKDDEELLNNMNELISKYNNAITSLDSFDRTFGTNHVNKIENLLAEFETPLKNLGINIIGGKELGLDEKMFSEKIKGNENALGFLFEPTKGLILKIYSVFRNIKVPKKTALESKYEDVVYRGMLLDNKT
ncbi:hypothetical protein R9X47_00140 [Wukongibacter baidiensis]|uniref:hypothetical protein n=1 Tax=Wukongibacter baidiensis TaxID=1723361 RepID=UPI003D7F24A0